MCDAQTTTESSRPGLLERLAACWRQQGELSSLPMAEMVALARDLGMDVNGLEEAAARDPGAADLLYRRMAALGLTRADFDRIAFGLMHGLEQDCSRCQAKVECEKDLQQRPAAPGWMAYCANAATLHAAQHSHGRAPI